MNKTKNVLLLLVISLLVILQLPNNFNTQTVQAAAAAQQPAPTDPAASAVTSFRFVSWGDTKTGLSTLASLSKQVQAKSPAFTLFNGDLESAGFTTTGMNNWKKAINAGNMFSRTMAVRGNHDASNPAGWQAYFGFNNAAATAGAKNYNALLADLTYSFVYGNSIFIGVDVPGDSPSYISSTEIAYIDRQLTAAETAKLTHAFLFFHGPLYPVANHNSCPTVKCPTAPAVANLIRVLNRHPIVSAIFNGHEHLQAFTYLDKNRIPEITHPFEQFITGASGAGPNSCNKPYRFNYCGSYQGYAVVTVAGSNFSVQFYQNGKTLPVKTVNVKK